MRTETPIERDNMLLGKIVRKAVIRTLTPEEAVTFLALAENADSCARGTLDMIKLIDDTRIGFKDLEKNLKGLVRKKAVKITSETYIEKGKEKTRNRYKVCIKSDYWKERDASIEPNI